MELEHLSTLCHGSLMFTHVCPSVVQSVYQGRVSFFLHLIGVRPPPTHLGRQRLSRLLSSIVHLSAIKEDYKYLVFRLSTRWNIFWTLVGILISIGVMLVALCVVKQIRRSPAVPLLSPLRISPRARGRSRVVEEARRSLGAVAEEP